MRVSKFQFVTEGIHDFLLRSYRTYIIELWFDCHVDVLSQLSLLALPATYNNYQHVFYLDLCVILHPSVFHGFCCSMGFVVEIALHMSASTLDELRQLFVRKPALSGISKTAALLKNWHGF